ncbi:hypothetical protein P7C73_g5413, partial [Tremellales sp. Uapishka_1]
MDSQHHMENDAVRAAAAAAAAAASLGLASIHENELANSHHTFHHHQLQQPDFSHKGEDGSDLHHHHQGAVDVDVHGLEIPTMGDEHVHHGHGEEELDLNLGMGGSMDDGGRGSFGRPPSIRKGRFNVSTSLSRHTVAYSPNPFLQLATCVMLRNKYAPSPAIHHAPTDDRSEMLCLDGSRGHGMQSMSMGTPQTGKKRKLGQRDSMGALGAETMDMRMAMGMAMDMGLAGEDEGEDLLNMSDEQMLESIAIDGYLADLPLSTFVHNLPYTAGHSANDQSVQYPTDDFPAAGDNQFPTGDMDQHTTSALRDAIFSLNESGGGTGSQNGDGTGNDDQHGDPDQQLDPHLALLDLSHAMPVDDQGNPQNNESGSESHMISNYSSGGCNHQPLVPHILALLTHHPLDPKQGSNTPLTLSVLAPLARSLRLFHALALCPICSSSPQQTLPQLALLSRTTTILTFPFPPINSSSVGSSAQITVHGARLSGTGLSEAIEQHIVGVIWDSWRAAIRETFALIERKAQEVITQSAVMATGEGATPQGSAETQRAGLMFQAMSRLVTAMDEVEGN